MPRPKPPLSTWIVRNRKRLRLTPDEVAARVDVSATTVRGWEAGRTPGTANLDALAHLFGEEPPDRPRTGDEALVAALYEQTLAITALVAALRPGLERIEPRLRALEAAVALQAGAAAQAPPVRRSPPASAR